MNEQGSDDPMRVWRHLRGRVSQRKARLYAAAACRLLVKTCSYPGRIKDGVDRAILAAEEYADGLLEDGKASEIEEETILATSIGGGTHPLLYIVYRLLVPDASEAAERVSSVNMGRFIPGLSSLQRDLFAGPTGKPHYDWLMWNDRTIPKLAQAIYRDRTFDRLTILADALLDAGCDNEELLAHCRSEGPHVKGCWAVDLILGKN